MSLKPYSILFKDPTTYQTREFCCYAFDAYHARMEAMELVQEVHDHPNSITCIRREDHGFDW